MNQVLPRTSAAGDSSRRVTINIGGHSASSTTVFRSSSDILTSARRIVSQRALENAVYGHLRAVRALGRTKISASEIAAALSVGVSDVITALKALRSKGVKFAE